MKPQIKAVRPVASQTVGYDPVFARDEEYAASMHGFVSGACRLAAKQVESGRAVSLYEAALRGLSSWLAATILGLVQAINANRVMRGGALKPSPPVRRLLGICIATGINDERAIVSRDFDVEQVVMSVASVA
jgi:hypothetical protein